MEKDNNKEVPITIFIRCSALHSRGELVNSFLYAFREELGIESWYAEDGLLKADAPVEAVEVKTSRKPYFLIEIRYPTPEELERRKSQKDPREEGAKEDSNEHAKNKQVTSLLLSLAEKVKEFNGQAVIISEASKGISVSEERKKLEERDRQKKRERDEAESKDAARQKTEGKPKDSLLAFVPRAVRRRC